MNAELREELNTASGQRKIRAVRRLEVVEAPSVNLATALSG